MSRLRQSRYVRPLAFGVILAVTVAPLMAGDPDQVWFISSPGYNQYISSVNGAGTGGSDNTSVNTVTFRMRLNTVTLGTVTGDTDVAGGWYLHIAGPMTKATGCTAQILDENDLPQASTYNIRII
jgi:hypothetical protein